MAALVVCSLAAIALAPLAGRTVFRRRVARSVRTLLSMTMPPVGPQQLAARWNSLPACVQRYLSFAIGEGAPAIRTVRLEHGGSFRPKPEQRWLPIQGVEYFTAATPEFVWSATVRSGPLMWIDACDRLHQGRGNMLVKLESLFTIADARGPEIDQGASLRWLAEAIWFPYAFAGETIRWEPVSEESATAYLIQKGAPVAATFAFDAEGRVETICGERCRDTGGGKAVLTTWVGRCGEYREFGRFRVPARVEVAWVMDGVEFAYARFDVTAIEYNVAG
ncbi:MAG TPA: DUF6544 family protein [Bryobacteraceae bacterium]|nr:DUF6544 family protein [Bryobacteraceae bacterium]